MQNMVQNGNTNLSHSVSQELYLIWLWFLVHMCKMMISPAIFFHFFKILIFQVFQSSSINAKMKFWGVPHLPHMCVIYTYFICHICHKLIVIMYVTTLDAVIFFVLFSYWRILSTILISISRVFLRVIYLILFSIIAILKIKNYVIKNFGVVISIISFWLSYTSHEDGPFD